MLGTTLPQAGLLPPPLPSGIPTATPMPFPGLETELTMRLEDEDEEDEEEEDGGGGDVADGGLTPISAGEEARARSAGSGNGAVKEGSKTEAE